MGRLELFVLGPPRVALDGSELRLDTRKTLALLIYLAVTRERYQREALVNLLWPDSDERRGRSLLRNSLSVIRQSIGATLLDADASSVSVSAKASLWCDLPRFRSLLVKRIDQRGSPERCADLIAAVALYRSDALEGFHANAEPFEAWQRQQVVTAASEVAYALTELVDQLAPTDHGRALQYARRWLEVDPVSEQAHRSLMELYAAAGDRGAAMKQYADCDRALREAFGMQPDAATRALRDAIRDEDRVALALGATPAVGAGPAAAETAAAGQAARSRGNLPRRRDPYIGRERVITQARERLQSGLVVTLVGAAGIGKTRLAVQTGLSMAEQLAYGAWLIDLAPITDEAMIDVAVARTLAIPEGPRRTARDALLAFLEPRELLLVLDNCEHLLSACADLVEALLAVCPDVAVLATSREALRYQGEQVIQVRPLSIPDESASSLSEARAFESVQLFEARAAAAHVDFSVTEANVGPVVELCRRLDGIPLAIELAAVRSATMPLDQIQADLMNALASPVAARRTATPRHRTLNAAIDWSYERLTNFERRLLQELSVFADGCSLEAAAATAAAPQAQTAERLADLVSKSMVVLDHQSPPRFRLLTPIREYAAVKLRRARRAAIIQRRHRDWYLALAQRAEPELIGDRQIYWCDFLELELHNMRCAIDWSMEVGEHVAALQIGSLLLWFWQTRDYHRDTLLWLERALAAARDGDPLIRGRAHVTATWSAWCCGDVEASVRHALAGVDLLEASGDPRWQGLAVTSLAWVRRSGNRKDGFARGLEIFERSADLWGIAVTLMFLCSARLPAAGNDLLLVRRDYERVLRIARAVGDRTTQAWTLKDIAFTDQLRGDYHVARGRLEEAVLIANQLRSARGWGRRNETWLVGYFILANFL